MPVIRENIKVGAVQPGGIIRSDTARIEAEGWGNVAAFSASMAAEVGQLGTEMAAEEAVALAQNVVFTVDENGVPQYDKSTGDRLSIMARKHFDSAIDQRYANRLALEVDNRLMLARDEHKHNPEAFAAAAKLIVDEMSRTVPEAFKGRYGDIVRHASTKYGAEMGRALMEQKRQDRAAEGRVNATMDPDLVLSAARAGDEEAANRYLNDALARNKADLDNDIIQADEYHRREMNIRTAHAQGMLENRINTAAGGDDRKKGALYAEWSRKLYEGDEEATKLFPNEKVRVSLAGRMNQLARKYTGGEAKKEAAIKEANKNTTVHTGYGDPGKVEDRRRADTNPVMMDIMRKSFPDRDVVELTPDFWTHPNSMTDAVWTEIERMGVAPQSLNAALRGFHTFGDAGKEMLYKHWKMLKDGLNPDGVPMKVSGILKGIPDDIGATMSAIEASLAVGDKDTVGEAITDVLAKLEVADNDHGVFNKYASTGYETDVVGGMWSPTLSLFYADFRGLKSEITPGLFEKPEKFDADLRTYAWDLLNAQDAPRILGWQIGPNGKVPMETASAVATHMKIMLSTGQAHSINHAYAMTIQNFTDKNPKTDVIYMHGQGKIGRSYADPDFAFRVPEPEGFLAGAEEALGTLGGNMADAATLGATGYRDSRSRWWKDHVNEQINKYITTEFFGDTLDGDEDWEAGEDYALVPIPRSDTKPTYHVMMLKTGNRHQLLTKPNGGYVEIDLRPLYAERLGKAEDRRNAEMREAEAEARP